MKIGRRGVATVVCVAVALSPLDVWTQDTQVSGVLIFPEGRQDFRGARVFLEPGIDGALQESRPDDSGRFVFSGPYSGPVGLMAIAPGFGWTGRHLNLAAGERVSDVRLAFPQAASLNGQAVDPKGKPVSGAVVLRVAVTAPYKVGIPLSKLAGFGFEEIRSDDAGRFTVPNMPAGATVALKLAHPSFAQTATPAQPVGSPLTATLYPGVLVTGEVIDRALQSRVAGARVVLRNASPPHDSLSVQTDAQGTFLIRLNPGVYLARAEAADRMSPGWQEVAITGETPETRLRLPVSRSGTVTGKVADAISGEPIEGARIRMESGGFLAGVARTDAAGVFRVAASEGENTLYFESAPGYLPPEPRAVRVMVSSGQEVALPGIWLAPLPEFEVQVVSGEHNDPVAGAAVLLLEPRQLGWVMADSAGVARFRVNRIPESGRVTALAWHPDEPRGALFALDRGRPRDNQVSLLPCATVRGAVKLADGSPARGVTVGAVYGAEGLESPLVLWRAVTDETGAYAWPAVVPGVPQRVVALGWDGAELVLGDVNAAPAQDMALPDGIISAGAARQTKVPATPASLAERLRDKVPVPALVTRADDAAAREAWAETLAACGSAVSGITPVVVSGAAITAETRQGVRVMPISSSDPWPAGVDTLLLDRSGKAVALTAGLPPLFMVRSAAR